MSKAAKQMMLMDDLPIYEDDLERLRQKLEASDDDPFFKIKLPEQINDIMDCMGIEAATIYKAIDIPPSTLSGHINAGIRAPKMRGKLKRLAQFLDGVSLDYLVFGTIESEKDAEMEDRIYEYKLKNQGKTA